MSLSSPAPINAALQAAEQEAAFFRSVADNAADYVAVLDAQGRRLYSSTSYSALFGKPTPLRGTDSFKYVHPDDRALVTSSFASVVKTGIRQTIEYRFLLPDGSVRVMESRGAAIQSDLGEVVCVIVATRDVTERKNHEAQICEYAYFDALTKLPNRRLLLDRIQQAIRVSRRSKQFNALVYFDLDNFKAINDDFGHSAGDSILCETGRRASACIREADTLSRLGGDEYVILVSQLGCDQRQALTSINSVTSKLRRALAVPHIIVAATKSCQPVTRLCPASIGAVLFNGDAEAPETVLQNADAAMYLAKHDGGNGARIIPNPTDPLPRQSLCSDSASGTDSHDLFSNSPHVREPTSDCRLEA